MLIGQETSEIRRRKKI